MSRVIKSIYKKVAIVSLAAIFAVGCVTPAYKTADNLVEQQQYRNSSSDTTTIAAIKWSDYYSDPYLQKLISEALENNLNLKVAVLNIEKASQYFKQSKMGYVPTITAAANGAWGEYSQNGATPTSSVVSQYQLSLSANWELDIWGKISSAKRGAYATFLQTQAAKDGIVTSLVAEVATAYYQLVVLDAQKTITESTIKNYSDYLEKVEVMKEQGQTNEVAVLQAKVQLYGAQGYLPQVMAAIEATENYISLLLGKESGSIEREGLVALENLQSEELAGVPAQLLQYRPDVRAAELSMRVSHESLNVSKASMYPALTLTGKVGLESLEAATWFKPESMFWNAVAGLVAPILNGRALRTLYRVAELQNKQQYLNFKFTLLNATSEVSNALLQSNAARSKAHYTKMQYEALDLAFQYSQELFESGYATYLDVLSAQNGLFSTQIALYDSYLDVAKQKVELYRALGGGWR